MNTLAKIRKYLFVFLVLGAPLSRYPSIDMPLYGFSSFRIGLYQVVAALFVVSCAPILIRGFIKSRHDSTDKLVYGAAGILIAIAAYGVIGSIDFNRSLLMSASFILLILVVVCGYFYVKNTVTDLVALQKYMLIAGCVIGFVSIVQLVVGTFASTETALLCSRCGDGVFGFPRVSGFAAEPLFWANATIPFFVAALINYPKYKTAKYSLLLTSATIALTFARGALLAIAMILVVWAIGKLYKSKQVKGLAGSVIAIAGILAGFTLLVVSAVVRYNDAPYIAYNTVRGMAEHMTLGVVDLPEKLPESIGEPVPKSPEPFISQGLVEASGNDRLGAAEIALNVWRMPANSLLGVGLGNLGPYVVDNVDASAPRDLTVYVYYVLLLAEMGILGLGLVLALYGKALYRLMWSHGEFCQIALLSLLGFLVQYLFFGSYINVMYIWLWLGIGLGLRVELDHKHDKGFKAKSRAVPKV